MSYIMTKKRSSKAAASGAVGSTGLQAPPEPTNQPAADEEGDWESDRTVAGGHSGPNLTAGKEARGSARAVDTLEAAGLETRDPSARQTGSQPGGGEAGLALEEAARGHGRQHGSEGTGQVGMATALDVGNGSDNGSAPEGSKKRAIGSGSGPRGARRRRLVSVCGC